MTFLKNRMDVTPTIRRIAPQKLVGKRLKMSLADNKTVELWKSFMPERHLINPISPDFISLQDYGNSFPSGDFKQEFDKWALVEVDDFKVVPNGMETYSLIGGLYAIFSYKGVPSDSSIFQYIFKDWLPQSIYELDKRPHFEILGEKYKNGDPNSEEDIYIPVQLKKLTL